MGPVRWQEGAPRGQGKSGKSVPLQPGGHRRRPRLRGPLRSLLTIFSTIPLVLLQHKSENPMRMLLIRAAIGLVVSAIHPGDTMLATSLDTFATAILLGGISIATWNLVIACPACSHTAVAYLSPACVPAIRSHYAAHAVVVTVPWIIVLIRRGRPPCKLWTILRLTLFVSGLIQCAGVVRISYICQAGHPSDLDGFYPPGFSFANAFYIGNWRMLLASVSTQSCRECLGRCCRCHTAEGGCKEVASEGSPEATWLLKGIEVQRGNLQTAEKGRAADQQEPTMRGASQWTLSCQEWKEECAARVKHERDCRGAVDDGMLLCQAYIELQALHRSLGEVELARRDELIIRRTAELAPLSAPSRHV